MSREQQGPLTEVQLGLCREPGEDVERRSRKEKKIQRKIATDSDRKVLTEENHNVFLNCS